MTNNEFQSKFDIHDEVWVTWKDGPYNLIKGPFKISQVVATKMVDSDGKEFYSVRYALFGGVAQSPYAENSLLNNPGEFSA